MDPNKVADVRAKEIWSPIELNQLNKSGALSCYAFPAIAEQ